MAAQPDISFRNATSPYAVISTVAYVQSSIGGNNIPVMQGENSNIVLFRAYNNWALNAGIASALNVNIGTFDLIWYPFPSDTTTVSDWVQVYVVGAPIKLSVTDSVRVDDYVSGHISVGGVTYLFASDSTAMSESVSAPSLVNYTFPTPVNESWIRVYENGFGEGTVTPGNLTSFLGADTAVGGVPEGIATSNKYFPELGSDGTNDDKIRAGTNTNGLGFIEFATYAELPDQTTTTPFLFLVTLFYEWTS